MVPVSGIGRVSFPAGDGFDEVAAEEGFQGWGGGGDDGEVELKKGPEPELPEVPCDVVSLIDEVVDVDGSDYACSNHTVDWRMSVKSQKFKA